MKKLKVQAAVIGAGPGGYVCAIRLAQLGIDTICIEKDNWGGVCLNVGCIPSKALIHAGKQMQHLRHAGDMGIQIQGEPSIDMGKLQSWKEGIVDKLTGGVETLLGHNGAQKLLGTAVLKKPGVIRVTTAEGTVQVEAENIVLSTGSRPIEIPGFSFSDPRIHDSTGALALEEVPKKLVVIGGGYIGLELGGVYANLGSDVTVVELEKQVLPGFDPDVARVLTRRLKKLGVGLKLGTKALGWEETGDGAVVRIETPKGEETLEADIILVTVGRMPNTENLGLEKLGVEMDGRFIQIDGQCRTSVPGLWAIGDVAGQPMLAHKASYEGEVAAEAIAGHAAHKDAKTVPAVVFTDPEVATAGLMEHEAKAAGHKVKVGKVPFAAIGRALTTGETDGFVKVILDATDNRILGVTIVGSHASDLISEAALAIEMDAEALDISLTIHPHPTLSEGVMEAAKHAIGQAIHVGNK
jgi:dihydrolipoamide dehydrogenase